MSKDKKESSLSLSAKAKKFDVPLGTLKKVFRRGVAAWNSGHRPGTTPQQWGHARVNSYLRKGKTYHTADSDLHEEALIKGTNCKNCIWWKEDTEQKVDKSELNENGGLKAPNEQYIKMSKHVDMVSLPGKATVSVKAFCDHDDVKNFVTERMCCAYWNGEGTKREFKGEADVLSEEQLNELDIETYNKYVAATYSDSPAAQARKVGGPKNMQRNLGRLRARILKQKQIDKPENQTKIAQMRADHEALHNPTDRGYGEGRYMGDSVEIEDVNRLFEMQLVGTDEYRQHAIAMTPGQEQEIQDAFPSEVYGAQVYEPSAQKEPSNNESIGSDESADSSSSGKSFRSIRKKIQEQTKEEEEALLAQLAAQQQAVQDEEEVDDEEEEQQGENDGVEDGVDFMPTLKTKKPKNYVPQDFGRVDNSGLPVLSTSMFAEGDVVPVNFAAAAKLKKHPAYDPKKPIGLDPSGQVWQKVDLGKTKFEQPKPFPGMNPLMKDGKQIGFTTNKSGEMAPFLGVNKTQPSPPALRPVVVGPDGKEYNTIGSRVNVARRELEQRVLDSNKAASSAFRSAAVQKQAADIAMKTAKKTAFKSLSRLPFVGAAIGLGALAADRYFSKKDEPAPNKTTIKEAIDYHNENNISLVENIYRPGSEMFFDMLLEAKKLYSEGSYTPKDEFEQELLESNIGEVAEYNGQTVVLDFPIEEGLEECWSGYAQKGMKKKGSKMVPNCVPVNEEGDRTKGKGIGKPFRSGGGGAVYVRNGKGNIIKVNFSQSGMKKRYMEPGRVKSFVARHHCYTNKDRTSASYWACRWPRYFSDSGQQWW